MQKSLIIASFLLVAVPSVSLAAYNDATLTTDAVIEVGGISLTVSGASAVLDSITVTATNFTFTMQSGSSLEVTSADRKVLTTDASGFITVNTCDTSVSKLKHVFSGQGTLSVTVTPQSTTCGANATNATAATYMGGAGGGGGGGGGGGTVVSDTTVVYPTVVPGCPVGFTCRLVAPIVPNCPTGFVCKPASPGITSNNPVAAASIAGVSPVFTVRLVVGADSPDVTRLQKLLASDPSVYPEGRVTGYFGPLTRKAVQNFQVKYGVAKPGDEGFGAVGPMTRAAIKKVFGGAQ